MEEGRSPLKTDMLQISYNSEPPKSTKYTDDMFPLDDLVIVPGYSLESMAYGEKNANYENDGFSLATFEQITHSMCAPESEVKVSLDEIKENNNNNNNQPKVTAPVTTIKAPVIREDKENHQPLSHDVDEDEQGVIQNLVTMGVTIYSKFFQ